METAACVLLAVQGVLGAWDNFWNHEIGVGLPRKPDARRELLLHAARGLLYAPVFLVFAWLQLAGWYVAALALVLAVEIGFTLADFLEEDRTRVLPANERVLHTLLTLNYGAFLALVAPSLLAAFHEPSAIATVGRGLWSWLFTIYALGTLAWGVRDLRAALHRRRTALATWQRRQIMVRRCGRPKVVLVAGGTGFVGRELCWRLIAKGHRVLVFARDRAKAVDLFGPYVTPVTALAEISTTQPVDAIVNLAGEPIAGWWWTAWRKALLVESRVGTTRHLLEWAASRKRRPAVLVNASAVGWYGARGDERLDEGAQGGEGFAARLCRAWEREAMAGREIGMRVVALRLGLVLGVGGLVARMLPAFTLGLGAPFGKGTQWMPWIHMDDAVDIFERAMQDERLSGEINAVAPGPVTNREFSRTLATMLGRPLWPAIPTVMLRALAGELSTLFVDGQRVLPARLAALGHRFRYPALAPAFADVIRRGGRRPVALPMEPAHE
jgi:uncharacterized protein